MTNDELSTALLAKLDRSGDIADQLTAATEALVTVAHAQGMVLTRVAVALETMLAFSQAAHAAMEKDMAEQRALMESQQAPRQ